MCVVFQAMLEQQVQSCIGLYSRHIYSVYIDVLWFYWTYSMCQLLLPITALEDSQMQY